MLFPAMSRAATKPAGPARRGTAGWAAGLAASLVVAVLFCISAGDAHAATLCTLTTPPMYYYDAGGRLSAIMGPTSTLSYAYDLAGNMLSATSTANSTAQVLQLCPNGAATGSTITIWGSGFAAGDAVTFNGTAASGVSVVSANRIDVTVPSGATTGPVTVTPSGGAALAAPSAFTIGAAGPQITGIGGGTTISGILTVDPFPFYDAASGNDAAGTLTGAAAGRQTLTITGSGFDTTTPLINTRNKVWISGNAAQITAASATQLTVSVPNGGSALAGGAVPVVTVETPNGSANFTKSSLLVSPAGVGQFLINRRARFTTNTINGKTVNTSDLASPDSSEIDAIGKAVYGTTTTLTFGATLDFQHFAAFMFAGTAGQTVEALIDVKTKSGQLFPYGSIFIVGPDGNEVSAADLGGIFYPVTYPTAPLTAPEFWKLPKTGTYTIFAQNTYAAGATVSLLLNKLPATVALGTVSTGGSVSGSVGGFGTASASFTVPAGSNGRVTLKTSVSTVFGNPFLVTVTAPDGVSQVYNSGSPREGDNTGFQNPGLSDFSGPIAVPATGAGTTYTITFQSLAQNTSTVTFALASLAPDVTPSGGCAAWPAAGTTTSCAGTIAQAGQALSLTLPATTVFTGATPLIGTIETTSSNFTGCYEVLATDTALNIQFFRDVQCGGTDYSYALQFPAGSVGPYLIQVFGVAENTGSAQITLGTASALAPTSLSFGGSQTVNFTGPGQTQTVTLTGPTTTSWGQLSVSQPAWSQCLNVSITQASQTAASALGTYLQCPSGQSGSLGAIDLPSGTYTIALTPLGNATGSLQLGVSSASAPPAGSVPANGSLYTSWTNGSLLFTNAYTANVPTSGTAYASLVTNPAVSATIYKGGKACYDAQIAANGGTIFDSANQTNSAFVGFLASCGGLDFSAAAALPSPTASGTVTFNLNNATTSSGGTQTEPTSGSLFQTLYTFPAETYTAASPLGADTPAGAALAVTYPGQPVIGTFTTTSSTNYLRLVIGLDANLAQGAAFVVVTDSTTNVQLASFYTTEPMLQYTGLPTLAGHTVRVVVTPLANAVGMISLGASAQ